MLSLHYGDRDDAGIRALSVPAARLPAGRLYHTPGRTGERHGTGPRPRRLPEVRLQRPASRSPPRPDPLSDPGQLPHPPERPTPPAQPNPAWIVARPAPPAPR